MNKSTGGRVRLDRTSVKEGRRFFLVFAQSSCCLLSSSMMLEGDERDGRESRWLTRRRVTAYVTTHTCQRLLSHVVCKGFFTDSARNTYSVLTDGGGVGGYTVSAAI
jgi:hypothetical protein